MRIEDVKQLEYRLHEVDGQEWWQIALQVSHEAIKALRAEAWHPIEKAEEFGAKDGREVLIFSDAEESHLAFWGKATGSWVSDVGSFLDDRDVTHFRFISPPEGADGI